MADVEEPIKCESCATGFTIDELRPTPSDELYCDDCFHDSISACNSCCEEVWDDDIRTASGDRLCNQCHQEWLSQQEEESSIKSYEYKPIPKFLKVETETNPPYFGWELEVESNDSGTTTEEMADEIDDGHIYCKRDGSLEHGFEVVSHPMSEGWIKKNRQKIKDMLLTLKDEGYRSYQTTTCGIHIHISRKSFGTWHLYRFMKFFYDNPKLILVMSQRRAQQLDQWAKLGMHDDRAMRNMAKEKFRSGNRYTAINLTRNTAEVRIFRGTLHDVSFFKNLEFLSSLHRYTAMCNASDATPAKYFEWLKKHRNKYRNLDSFLSRKTIQIDQATGYVYDASKLKEADVTNEQDQRTEI